MVQTKYIIIEDIGRNLNAIGYNFRSPIYKPSKFPIETIGRLINESGVTKMFEVYEKDNSMKVLLNSKNYRKPFIELWKEENPDKIFPWETEIETVENDEQYRDIVVLDAVPIVGEVALKIGEIPPVDSIKKGESEENIDIIKISLEGNQENISLEGKVPFEEEDDKEPIIVTDSINIIDSSSSTQEQSSDDDIQKPITIVDSINIIDSSSFTQEQSSEDDDEDVLDEENEGSIATVDNIPTDNVAPSEKKESDDTTRRVRKRK